MAMEPKASPMSKMDGTRLPSTLFGYFGPVYLLK